MIYEKYYVSKLFLKNVINVGVLIFMVLFCRFFKLIFGF